MENNISRQEVNRLILNLLSAINEETSDLRFGQLLISCGITFDTADRDPKNTDIGTTIAPRNEVLFFEESDSMAKRVMIRVTQMREEYQEFLKGQKDVKTSEPSKSLKKSSSRKSKKS